MGTRHTSLLPWMSGSRCLMPGAGSAALFRFAAHDKRCYERVLQPRGCNLLGIAD
jgi:hypothetical protein